MEPENYLQNIEQKVLTSIHETYTLSNTEDGFNEVDRLVVKNFMNTMADIALAIASRNGKEVSG